MKVEHTHKAALHKCTLFDGEKAFKHLEKLAVEIGPGAVGVRKRKGRRST